MISPNEFILDFKDLCFKEACSVVSVSGLSGLGKTSFVLYAVSNLLYLEKSSCVWVQASEGFPKNRLVSMFKTNKKVLDYLSNNFFVVPKLPCQRFSDLVSVLKNFSSLDCAFPPNTRYIVIDNVSHLLRYRLQHFSDANQRGLFLNDFFSSILYPFLTFCFRNKIVPFLIHEMSFNPNLNQNKAFFSTLFDRIESVFITLRKNEYSENKFITIASKGRQQILKYRLNNEGFEFYF